MSPSHVELILLGILTVTSYSLVGLLAIWAGLGRPHWFLRVAVVGGILLLLLLIPAYEPLLIFSIQSAVVILPLMLLRAFRAPVPAGGPKAKSQTGAIAWRRPQFSLSDLLLLTVVVAVAVAVAVRVPSDVWEFWTYVRAILDPVFPVSSARYSHAQEAARYGLVGVTLGVSAFAATWVALGRRRFWLRLIVLCLVPTSAVMAGWLALARASGWLTRSTRRMASSATANPPTAITRPIIRRVAMLGALVLSLLILLPPVATFCVLVAPAPDLSQIVLPDPNGYDDLLRVSQALGWVSMPDAHRATRQQLEAFVTSYRPLLGTARLELDRRCMVPLEDDMCYFSRHDARCQSLRRLVRLFLAEGKLAEIDGRPDGAVRSYLDVARLGHAAARGGLVVDWLGGQAIEGSGVEALTELRETLASDQCHELIQTLEAFNANWEPLQDVCDRDHSWERTVFDNWKYQLDDWLSIVSGTDSASPAMLQESANRNQARLRLLICGLALRSYCLEKGQPPERLADLVPDYLQEVPQDPYSGKPLVYRREGGKYVLFGVGPHAQDDGGKP